MSDGTKTIRPDKEMARRERSGEDLARRPSFAARGLLALISFYRRFLSPGRPACCRFTPTCSTYALEAIERHGALRGGGLALWRLLRCQPFGRGGYDPVPESAISGKDRILPDGGGGLGRGIRKETL